MPVNYNKPVEIRDLRNGEWYWVHKVVIEDKNLKASDKLTYHALAYFAHNRDQTAYPSLTTISKLTGYCRRTTVAALRRLTEAKYIHRELHRGRVSIYTLLRVPNLHQCKRDTGTHAKEALPQYSNCTTPVQKKHTNNNKRTRLINKREKVKIIVDNSPPRTSEPYVPLDQKVRKSS